MKTTKCTVCGEDATRVYRGYPMCPDCDALLDEMLALADDEFLWASPAETKMMNREGLK